MTIAEQLNVTEFPFIIHDSRGNEIYWEDSNKSWQKTEFDSNNNLTSFLNSGGYSYKQEFDLNSNVTYYENSKGVIRDNRPKAIPEYTMEELTKIVGKEFKIKE